MANTRQKRQEQSAASQIPEIVRVQYDDGTLRVRWDPQDHSDFVVSVELPGQQITNYPATGDRITIEQELSPTESYEVFVTALVGGDPGPTSPKIKIISQIPVFDQIMTDHFSVLGYALNLKWTACANANEYEIVLTGGAAPQTYNTEETSYKIVEDLDPNTTYTLSVTPMGSADVSIGPQSQSYNPIMHAPVLNMLAYELPTTEKGNVKTVWGAVEGEVTGYITHLKATNGSLIRNEITTEPNSEIDIDLENNLTYTVSVAAGGAKGVIIGPSSAPLIVIQNQPDLSLLSYLITNDDGGLHVTWGSVENAGLYGSILTNSEGHKQNFFTATTDLQEAVTLDQELTYTLVVSALSDDGVVIGPASTEYNVIIHWVEKSRLNYTGTQLISDYTIPALLDGSSFVGNLYKDGTSVLEETSQTSQITYDQSLDKGKIFTTQIRAENGIVKGPNSTLVYGPYAADVVNTFDEMSRLKTVTWNGQTQIEYTLSDPGNITQVTTSVVLTTEKKTVRKRIKRKVKRS